MLSALDSSFTSCCSIVQFYELLLVLSFRHVTEKTSKWIFSIYRSDTDLKTILPDVSEQDEAI